MDDGTRLAGLLADERRLRVFAAVALGATSLRAVAEAAALDERDAATALDRLVRGGIVDSDATGSLRVATERFGEVARAAAAKRPRVTPEDLGATPDQAAVLRGFLDESGRLRSLPVARGRRRVVLDFVAQQFEPGRRYPEREVNEAIMRFFDDYATVRRYMVDEEILDRDGGWYWRAGGTFDAGA